MLFVYIQQIKGQNEFIEQLLYHTIDKNANSTKRILYQDIKNNITS